MSDKETFEELEKENDLLSERFSDISEECLRLEKQNKTLEADNKLLNGVIEKAKMIHKTDSTGMYVNGAFLTYKQAVIILCHYYKGKLKERGE